MIDWLTATIPCVHKPLPAGRVVSIDTNGTVCWDIPQRLTVRGSHDSNVQLRSSGSLDHLGRATELQFSGNPSKFLQGHNLHGSSDLCGLLADSLCVAGRTLRTDLSSGIKAAYEGRFTVSRVDYAVSYRLSDTRTVDAALAGLCHVARGRSGRATTSGSTVYIQQRSRRWSFKFYNKGAEVLKHQLSEELVAQGLTDYAQGLLRAELTLRGLELEKLDLRNGAALAQKISEIFEQYLDKVDIPMNVKIPSEEIQSLPRALKCTYLQWAAGIDVRPTVSKATFYRHRSELLPRGVDIAVPTPTAGEVIPMFRTVKGDRENVPSHWHRQGFIHQPRGFLHAV